MFFDAFDEEGRYLGEIRAPQIAGFALEAFIRDDILVAPVIDEQGTTTVRLYRIVFPGG